MTVYVFYLPFVGQCHTPSSFLRTVRDATTHICFRSFGNISNRPIWALPLLPYQGDASSANYTTYITLRKRTHSETWVFRLFLYPIYPQKWSPRFWPSSTSKSSWPVSA